MIRRDPVKGIDAMYRQGDILVMKVNDIPKAAKKVDTKGRVILEHGEVTGHAHAVREGEADLFMEGQTKYLQSVFGMKPAVEHDEHETIPFVAATSKKEVVKYEVRRQCEYDYNEEMARVVRD